VDLSRAIASLHGVRLGDAFGEQFFDEPVESIARRSLPPGLWRYTDDTAMAISVVRVLRDAGRVDPDRLAQAFAEEFAAEPRRGYAGGAKQLLDAYRRGGSWRRIAPALFEGGSYGNGAAMRATPIGACFAEDPSRVAEEADASAIVTHAHVEGRAGAVAVALATSAWVRGLRGDDLLSAVATRLPESEVRAGIEAATSIREDAEAAQRLGTGGGVAAFDTAPFCLWMAARHGEDFEDCLWRTLAGLGDRDTTCAIVGGILAADERALPDLWLAYAEDLPADLG